MRQPDWNAAIAEAEAIAAGWATAGAPEPGGAVLLFDCDGIRGEACAGLASIQHRIPFTTSAPTRFASITKHVLCAFALHRGLDLDAPLGTVLPGLPPPLTAVPACRALSMTAGIPDLLQSYTLCGVPHTAGVDSAALDAFTDTLPALDSEPGSEMSYSNTGYRLVEHTLARQGGAFGAWVEGALNAALGTGFRFPTSWDRPLPGLAEGYWRDAPDMPWRIGSYGMALSASGALTGSARDLAAWLRALLRGDGPAGDVLAHLATPVLLRGERPSHYGLGLAVADIGGRRLIGHGGHLPGFKNHFLLDPASGAGVILLSNREETEPYLLALRIMAALLGLPLPRPAERLLPEGLFVEDDGPAWIEHRDGVLTFLGAREALFTGDVPGEVVSLSPYLPIRLHREGGGIDGEVGHAARRFRPVPPRARLPASLAGTWRAAAQHAELIIEVAADGSGSAALGAGPLHRRVPLTPLGGGRALMAIGAAPWPGRACAWLRTPDTLRLVTNRSRVLDFLRL